MSSTASVSIVVAAPTGGDTLARCLRSIASQDTDAEVIVATATPPSSIARDFPRVALVQAPHGSDVFRLRSLGVRAARGTRVVLTEDHVEVGSRWLAALAQGHARGAAVVTGPVAPAFGGGLRKRALYLAEYASLMPPRPAGPVTYVSAVNASYLRVELSRVEPVWRDGFFDNEVADALGAAGLTMVMAPDAEVRSHLVMSTTEALDHMASGGRRFGSYRARRAGSRRLLWACAAPAVPLLLLLRALRSVATRRPLDLPATLAAVPMLAVLLASWGLGEAAGYLRPATGAACADES